jgi:hypothetical protein
VVIPPRLRAKYPQEMTIVLQHQFWDLKMDQDAELITVGLSFGGVPASLAIPLESVTAFADPYVRYGLRFRTVTPEEAKPEEEAPGMSAEDQQTEAGSEQPQVVSLDAFRRRNPQKD